MTPADMLLISWLSIAIAVGLLRSLIPDIVQYVRSKSNLRRLVLVVFVQLCLVVLAFVSCRTATILAKQSAEDYLSRENMTALSKAILMYTNDCDGTLPPARYWEDAIAKRKYFSKPNFQRYFVNPAAARNGYALNSAVAGKKLSSIKTQNVTVLLFESKNMGRNVTGSASDLTTNKRDWYFAFCGGEVARRRPNDLDEVRW